MRTELPTHDNTMMSAYSYCERLYALRHKLHRRPIFTKPALGFGGLVHLGLGAIYTSFAQDDKAGRRRDVSSAADKALEAMHKSDFEDPLDDYRTLGRAEKLLISYLKERLEDPDIQNIQHVETAHDVLLADGMPWGGIIDLWCDYKYNGLHIIDHKTTSRFGEHYFDEYFRSPQMIMYLISAAALTGTWPEGVVVNVLVNRPGSKDPKKKTSTSMFQFERKRIPYPTWLVDEVKLMQEVNYERLEKQHALHKRESDVWDPRIWRPNIYNCHGKYGPCSMYEVCHSMPANREQVILQETEESEWDWREIRGDDE